MDINLDIDYIKSKGLKLSEYLYLRNLVVPQIDKIPNLETLIDSIDVRKLDTMGYIKYTTEGVYLRQPCKDLFDSKDLFDKFLTAFPIKTPKGRYLSPKGINPGGVAYNNLKKKWDRIFKNSRVRAEKAIEVLEAEIKWRKSGSGSDLEFMHNIETWLNQADYENLAYLLDENLNEHSSSESFNDWIG